MQYLKKHLPRIAVTLLPVLLALLHVTGVARLSMLDRLDDLIYDARLRLTMPRTLDDRIVIVDIDEKSLAEVGRWPWSRDKLAALTENLFMTHNASVVGFDIVFAEPDQSSGLKHMQALADREFRDIPGFAERVRALSSTLDTDELFAKALQNRAAVLGFYLTSDRGGRVSGALPHPVMDPASLRDQSVPFTSWNGYGANIPLLTAVTTAAGYFNSITDDDGVVRSVPLVAELNGAYYEALSLAVFRRLLGVSTVEPGFPPSRLLPAGYQGLESILVKQGDKALAVPVDRRVATLIPYRGAGGPDGGSYRYISASDVLSGRVDPTLLEHKIVLVGTTAPGLLDLRVTPVGAAYPGVEAHANLISGLLDGELTVRPDYALGYELLMILVAGVALALALPALSAIRAVVFSSGVFLVVTGLNTWLYLANGLVLPLATALFMILTAFALNMSYGYFVESRSKRDLAHLFGTYVPPELVEEMVKDPDSYSMQAEARELTVMFCDMRGFTQLSEKLEPVQLQALLNTVFSRLTQVIRTHQGTIDKYMGDCVMAFWGAPVHNEAHALCAVRAALGMSVALAQINAEHRHKGLPEIGFGIGLNTGLMFVGDMGSDIRRSYTVIGDAVNLGSRLEALSRVYGVELVVGASTRRLVNGLAWQELDRVQVKGKEEAVSIFTVLPGASGEALADKTEHAADPQPELETWAELLKAYRQQDWESCDRQFLNLSRLGVADRPIYQLYAARIARQRLKPLDNEWDGTTRFDNK